MKDGQKPGRGRLDDRRRRERYEVMGRLWATLESTEPLRLRDVGTGGAMVESRELLRPDSVRRVRLAVNGVTSDVQVRVRHSRRLEDGGEDRYLVGLEFVDPEPAVAAELDRLIGSAPGSPDGGEK